MKFKNTSTSFLVITFLLLLLTSSCATYNSKSSAFQNKLQEGNIEGAISSVEQNKFLGKQRNRLLYLLEKGKLAYLQGDYKSSNVLLNEADAFIESNKKAIGNQLLGAITNSGNETYKGEDFEKVAIHYYKALNYTFLKQYDEALVEAKKINLRLQELNDKYPDDKKNRYKNDAFAHNLQGLLYEASGDINNAFIAYRNAVDLYLEYDGVYFGVAIPQQLKKDILRTATDMGFVDQVERYEKKLETKYEPKLSKGGGDVIMFWENGLAPYKDQTFFTFTILPGNQIGYATIVNKDLAIDLPLPITTSANNRSEFSDINVFNVAFPKYVTRAPLYESANIMVNNQKYTMDLAQNYQEVAIQTLKDRTLREIGKSALRLGIKKVSEYTLRNQNTDLGALLGLVNAFTERADTRNWQSLPNYILYKRIPLLKGENVLDFQLQGSQKNQYEFKIFGSGGLQFQKIATPEVYN